MKTCGKCHIEKEESEFSIDRKSRDGKRSYCKGCDKKYKRKYYKKNKAKLAKKHSKYYLSNREKRLNYIKQWASTPEGKEYRAKYLLGYKKKNKDAINRANKEYIKKVKKTPEGRARILASANLYAKKQVDKLSDTYIRNLLICVLGYPKHAINKELIEERRLVIKIKRLLYKTKHHDYRN